MEFEYDFCSGNIKIESDIVTIIGNIDESVTNYTLEYSACSPADRRMSVSGSGLPYANEKMAFENSPNKGAVKLGKENSFTIFIKMPGSYYENLGSILIPPTVFLKYNNGIKNVLVDIPIAHPVPYRLLSYPSEFTRKREGADFYSNSLPTRSQEQILRDSAYPDVNMMEENFWGLKPPM